ncbi:MAG: beta-N-acetylhexosaminidase [Oceanicaulis sp.]|uniref:beta-N-acetylhexosaminidase n=1 Tax=Oceanicaulis sp. UBA2681 TaxID=1947007 RepID=UPI000C0BB6E6|nr:beta-N-acetylhexosaminidase [Oceanicaulis sp. UBA2681]MAP49281.1 beta-N-acetylhexosaminidase [Oceanicaulis sp.]|tara:strand:- start:12669 stop:13697 length:1029 start_codon:yes stop_codon:yes gene_type:complete
MSISAALYGLDGETLTPDEKAFFRDSDPWGFIVFARNVDTPKQVRRLTGALREAVGREAPVFIDQEGGRVQRLRPPHWRAAPPARIFGELYDREPELALEAVRLNHQLLGAELIALGIDVDFAPCADLSVPGAHDVIGDRAFHTEPEPIAQMSTAALDGLLDQGVLGVIKHLPGHGRAAADSHLELPVVTTDAETLATRDFAAFKGIEGALMAMTAHVVYASIDSEHTATQSRDVVDGVIRGAIDFDGLLMTDDLSMQALEGSLQQRGERALAAGCELLMHCNGKMSEMVEVAHAAPALGGHAAERAGRALDARHSPNVFDAEDGVKRLKALFDQGGVPLAS